MKIDTTLEQVKTNFNTIETFKINANAVMFKMLSSDIYSNKIRAVIRELSTNAIDSMVEAGTINTHKFYVHLPTDLDPMFRIRDYGTGVDDEGIKRIYTYGDSNRRDSNSFTGAFGIGSKSPFAYTTSGFTVKSYKDGILRIYSAFIINGEPKITKVKEEATTEYNGLEVSMGVDSTYDCNNFEREAKAVYRWFKYKPECNLPLDLDNIVKFETDSCISVKDGPKYGVLMGDVFYDYPSSFWYDAGYAKRSLLNEVILKLPIGSVSLQPSREYIDNTKENRDLIYGMFDIVFDELKKDFHKKILESINGENLFQNLQQYHRSLKCGYPSAIINDEADKHTTLKQISGRMFVLNKRGFNLLARRNPEHISEVNTKIMDFTHVKKSNYFDLTNKIVVKDRHEVAIEKIFTKIHDSRATFIVPIRKAFLKDGRCDYATMKQFLTDKIKRHLRCSDKDLIFVSDLFPIENTVRKPRTKNVVQAKTFESMMSDNGVTFDVKNPPVKTYYATLSTRRDRELTETTKLNSTVKQEIRNMIKDIRASLGETDTYEIIVNFKDMISPKMLTHPNYVEIKSFLSKHQNLIKTQNFNVYQELHDFFCKGLYSYEWSSFFNQDNKKIRSIFLKELIKDDATLKDFSSWINSSNRRGSKYAIIKEAYKLTFDEVNQIEPEWFTKYKEKFGKAYDSLKCIRESGVSSQDITVALWECWYEHHPEFNE